MCTGSLSPSLAARPLPSVSRPATSCHVGYALAVLNFLKPSHGKTLYVYQKVLKIHVWTYGFIMQNICVSTARSQVGHVSPGSHPRTPSSSQPPPCKWNP